MSVIIQTDKNINDNGTLVTINKIQSNNRMTVSNRIDGGNVSRALLRRETGLQGLHSVDAVLVKKWMKNAKSKYQNSQQAVVELSTEVGLLYSLLHNSETYVLQTKEEPYRMQLEHYHENSISLLTQLFMIIVDQEREYYLLQKECEGCFNLLYFNFFESKVQFLNRDIDVGVQILKHFEQIERTLLTDMMKYFIKTNQREQRERILMKEKFQRFIIQIECSKELLSVSESVIIFSCESSSRHLIYKSSMIHHSETSSRHLIELMHYNKSIQHLSAYSELQLFSSFIKSNISTTIETEHLNREIILNEEKSSNLSLSETTTRHSILLEEYNNKKFLNEMFCYVMAVAKSNKYTHDFQLTKYKDSRRKLYHQAEQRIREMRMKMRMEELFDIQQSFSSIIINKLIMNAKILMSKRRSHDSNQSSDRSNSFVSTNGHLSVSLPQKHSVHRKKRSSNTEIDMKSDDINYSNIHISLTTPEDDLLKRGSNSIILSTGNPTSDHHQLQVASDEETRKELHHQFVSEIIPSGDVEHMKSFPFEFTEVQTETSEEEISGAQADREAGELTASDVNKKCEHSVPQTADVKSEPNDSQKELIEPQHHQREEVAEVNNENMLRSHSSDRVTPPLGELPDSPQNCIPDSTRELPDYPQNCIPDSTRELPDSPQNCIPDSTRELPDNSQNCIPGSTRELPDNSQNCIPDSTRELPDNSQNCIPDSTRELPDNSQNCIPDSTRELPDSPQNCIPDSTRELPDNSQNCIPGSTRELPDNSQNCIPDSTRELPDNSQNCIPDSTRELPDSPQNCIPDSTRELPDSPQNCIPDSTREPPDNSQNCIPDSTREPPDNSQNCIPDSTREPPDSPQNCIPDSTRELPVPDLLKDDLANEVTVETDAQFDDSQTADVKSEPNDSQKELIEPQHQQREEVAEVNNENMLRSHNSDSAVAPPSCDQTDYPLVVRESEPNDPVGQSIEVEMINRRQSLDHIKHSDSSQILNNTATNNIQQVISKETDEVLVDDVLELVKSNQGEDIDYYSDKPDEVHAVPVEDIKLGEL